MFLFQVPDGENLAKVEVHVIDLGYKDGCHGLVQRSTIHVDGGTDW